MNVSFSPPNTNGIEDITVLGNSNPLQSLSLTSAILLKESSWQPVTYMHMAMRGGGKNSFPV